MKQYTIALSLLLTAQTFAAELNIPQNTLSITGKNTSNILFVFDDSGSMDWHFITQPHYEYCNYFNPDNRSSCSRTQHTDAHYYFSKVSNGRFRTQKYSYLFDHENINGSDKVIDDTETYTQDWRIFDAQFNKIFYNPSVKYIPWKGPCKGNGKSIRSNWECKDANPKKVRAHPKKGHSRYNVKHNITNYYHDNQRFYHKWVVSLDDKSFSGSRPTPDNIITSSNGMVDPWDSHIVFSILNRHKIKAELFITDSGPQQIKMQEAVLTRGKCYDVLGSTEFSQDAIKNPGLLTKQGGEDCRTTSDAIVNYSNWMQYYMRRDYAAKAALSHIIDLFPENLFGISFLNNASGNVKYPINLNVQDYANANNKLLHDFFLHELKYEGTPLVSALNTAGRYYAGELQHTSPITSACQTNNAIVITDGQWQEFQLPRLGDADGDGFGGRGSSLSDVARYYYLKDLAPNILSAAIPPIVDLDSYLPSPRRKSMTTFGVTFGVAGNLQAGSDGWPSPKLGVSDNWGNPGCGFSRTCEAKIDDLWHAAYNSGGGFVKASNVEELRKGLEKTLSSISSNSNASLGGVAASTRLLVDDLLIYQGTFDSTNWSGNVSAYSLTQASGLSSTPTWSAATVLDDTDFTNRVIYSHNGQQGVLFSWPHSLRNPAETDINEAQIQNILSGIEAQKNRFGRQFVDYIKGQQTFEISHQGDFRTRTSKLGDIMYSSPVYIGPPSSQYKDQSYLEFKQAYSVRTPMLAVGANDGMLHIFDAQNGTELLGYVPGYTPLWENLRFLSSPNYEHRFFVDATPTVADYYAHEQNRWRTILTGSLGRGGQAIYALDITNASFPSTTTDASSTVLWEFSDKDDADMGFYLGSPQVVRMANNNWAVIVGNGYNSHIGRHTSGSEDPQQGAGQAALFILYLTKKDNNTLGWEEGNTYIKIPVGEANRNGLSEPFPIDVDEDGKVDYIYAGDLNGDMWRFDVRSTEDGTWQEGATKIFSAANGSGQQPIVQAPVVGPHPFGVSKGVMVYFGTGKYLEPEDLSRTNQPIQAIYGLWDKLDGSSGIIQESALLTQHIEQETSKLRAVTSTAIDWGSQDGWKLPLVTPVYSSDGSVSYINNGEKITSKPILRNGNLIFVATQPPGTSEDSCQVKNGDSWLMEVNASTGGRLNYAVFDVNADNQFDKNDYLTYKVGSDTIEIPHSGIKSDSGEVQSPPLVITSPDNDEEIKISSGSGGLSAELENPGINNLGRQSWQEVY